MITVVVKNTSTGAEVELPYNNLTINDELNKGSDLKLSLSREAVKQIADIYGYSVADILHAGEREIWVDKDGTKLFYGVITDYGASRSGEGINLDIAGAGFMYLLGRRRTGNLRVFTTTDAGLIAWTIIDESQSEDAYSDLGITLGRLDTSVSRDRTFRFDNIKEQIEKMSNSNLENGFDFEIDTNKQFNVYYPQKGTRRTEILFDDHNIVGWRVRFPLLSTLTNRVYVLGEGQGDDRLWVVRNSPDDYKQTFGLLENVLTESSIITTETLDDKGDKNLADNQSPRREVAIEVLDNPSVLDYQVGDEVRVKIPEEDINDEYLRLYKRTIQIDDNGAVRVALDVK